MKLLTIYILLFLNVSMHAQQDNYYTLFWNKKSLYNPASSGVKQKYYAAIIGRKQWVGNTDDPFRITAVFDTKLNLLHGGAGINLIYENFDPIRGYNGNLNYNYQISFPNRNILSIGLSGGLINEKVDLSQIDYDPLEVTNDNYILFNFKFGLYYTSKHFDLGVSSEHFKTPDELPYNSNIISNYWIFSSYWFPLFENIVIQPNLLLKMYDTDINDTKLYSGLLITFNENLWTGISYSTNGNIGAMIGYDIIKKFRVGYSFDFIKSSFTEKICGNHEIILALII